MLNSNGVVKNDLSLSHSPPPVLPTILRQSSQSRTTSIEQMIPTSVLRSQKQNETKISVEHPATKMFEEQLALLDAKSSNSTTINNWEQSSGSEEDEQIERICRMNNTKTISGPIQFKLNRTHHLPLKQSPAANETTNTEDESQPTKKKRTDESEPTFSSTNNSNEKLEQLSNNQNQENPTERKFFSSFRELLFSSLFFNKKAKQTLVFMRARFYIENKNETRKFQRKSSQPKKISEGKEFCFLVFFSFSCSIIVY